MLDISGLDYDVQNAAMLRALLALNLTLHMSSTIADVNGVQERIGLTGLNPQMVAEIYRDNEVGDADARALCEGIVVGVQFMRELLTEVGVE